VLNLRPAAGFKDILAGLEHKTAATTGRSPLFSGRSTFDGKKALNHKLANNQRSNPDKFAPPDCLIPEAATCSPLALISQRWRCYTGSIAQPLCYSALHLLVSGAVPKMRRRALIGKSAVKRELGILGVLFPTP
jgi:hypothetical protein